MRVILFILMYEYKAVLPIDETLSLTIKDCIFQIVKEVSYIKEQVQLII